MNSEPPQVDWVELIRFVDMFPRRSGKATLINALQSGRELEAQRDRLQHFIDSNGYRRCDIPACNCGSFHGGNASNRLMEISDALEDRTHGKTLLGAVQELMAESETLKAIANDGCGQARTAGPRTLMCPDLTDDREEWCWCCIARAALQKGGDRE